MQSIPTLATVQNILSNLCPSRRCEETLETIHRFVANKTELSKEPLWNFLPPFHQKRLCAYFRYARLENEALLNLSCEGRHTKLLVLVRGTAEISCGDFKLHISGEPGVCFGDIRVPKSVNSFISRVANKGSLEKGICRSFLRQMKNKGIAERSVISLHKYSHYIYICSIECRNYIEGIFDKLMSHCLLTRFQLNSLRRRIAFYTFPRGHPIFIEGFSSNQIIVVIRGKCGLRRNHNNTPYDIEEKKPNATQDSIRIAWAGPLYFLGFVPHFTNIDKQPLTVVAETNVKGLIFNVCDFMESIKDIPQLTDTFREISTRQLDWLSDTLPRILSTQNKCDQKHNNLTPERGINHEHNFPSSKIDIEGIIRSSRTMKSPKLKKCKLLSEFKRLISGEEKGAKWMEYEKPDDSLSGFDFIDASTYDLEKELEVNCRELEDDSNKLDAFTVDGKSSLTPYPSILLSRQLHGKTLPHVPRSDGFLNPFSL